MDDAQDIVAFIDRIDDNAHCINIENFFKRFSLNIHFAIDAINALNTSIDINIVVFCRQPLANFILDLLQKALAVGAFKLQH